MGYFYHISSVDLGPTVILTPSIPRYAHEIEPNIPRVCFSTSINGCLASISGDLHFRTSSAVSYFLPSVFRDYVVDNPYDKPIQNPVIYTVETELVEPPDVLDLRATGEFWSFEPIQVARIGYLSLRVLMFDGKVDIIEEDKSNISALEVKCWGAGVFTSQLPII